MKKILFTTIFLLLLSALSAQVVYFEGNLREAVAKAKRENKLVMVLASATWCGPCKKLTGEIMTDKSVGDYFNAKLVTLKYYLDVADPDKIMETFGVRVYPTMIILDGNGKEMIRTSGGSNTPADFLKKISAITDIRNTPESWEKRIREDSTEILNYLVYLGDTYRTKEARIKLGEYLEKLPIELTFSPDWFAYYRKNVVKFPSPVITLMLDNKKQIQGMIGKEEYEKFLLQKAAYFLSMKTNNKFYDRQVLEDLIDTLETIPVMKESDYIPFLKKNMKAIDDRNFDKVYRDAFRRMKRADYFTKNGMINTVGMIGIQKRGMKKSDPCFTALFNEAIRYEENEAYRERLVKSRDKLMEKE